MQVSWPFAPHKLYGIGGTVERGPSLCSELSDMGSFRMGHICLFAHQIMVSNDMDLFVVASFGFAGRHVGESSAVALLVGCGKRLSMVTKD